MVALRWEMPRSSLGMTVGRGHDDRGHDQIGNHGPWYQRSAKRRRRICRPSCGMNCRRSPRVASDSVLQSSGLSIRTRRAWTGNPGGWTMLTTCQTSGYEAPVLTKHCPTVTGMPNLQTHSAGSWRDGITLRLILTALRVMLFERFRCPAWKAPDSETF